MAPCSRASQMNIAPYNPASGAEIRRLLGTKENCALTQGHQPGERWTLEATGGHSTCCCLGVRPWWDEWWGSNFCQQWCQGRERLWMVRVTRSILWMNGNWRDTSSAASGEEVWATIHGAVTEEMWAGLAHCSERQDKGGKLDGIWWLNLKVGVQGGPHIGALVTTHIARDGFLIPMGVSAWPQSHFLSLSTV